MSGLAEWLAGQVGHDEARAREIRHPVRQARALREVAFKRTLLISDLPEWVAAEMARVYEGRPGYREGAW